MSDEFNLLCVRLDEISQSEKYDKAKESRIAGLRSSERGAKDERERTGVLSRLITEFEAYNADSALYYINLNLRHQAVNSNPDCRMRLCECA